MKAIPEYIWHRSSVVTSDFRICGFFPYPFQFVSDVLAKKATLPEDPALLFDLVGSYHIMLKSQRVSTADLVDLLCALHDRLPEMESMLYCLLPDFMTAHAGPRHYTPGEVIQIALLHANQYGVIPEILKTWWEGRPDAEIAAIADTLSQHGAVLGLFRLPASKIPQKGLLELLEQAPNCINRAHIEAMTEETFRQAMTVLAKNGLPRADTIGMMNSVRRIFDTEGKAIVTGKPELVERSALALSHGFYIWDGRAGIAHLPASRQVEVLLAGLELSLKSTFHANSLHCLKNLHELRDEVLGTVPEWRLLELGQKSVGKGFVHKEMLALMNDETRLRFVLQNQGLISSVLYFKDIEGDREAQEGRAYRGTLIKTVLPELPSKDVTKAINFLLKIGYAKAEELLPFARVAATRRRLMDMTVGG